MKNERTVPVRFQAELGAEPVLVVWDDGLDPSQTYGQCEGSAQYGRLIRLGGARPGPVRGTTFLHEVLHLVADGAGGKLSERQVRTLEVGIAQFLRSNPAMSRWWLRELLRENEEHVSVTITNPTAAPTEAT